MSDTTDENFEAIKKGDYINVRIFNIVGVVESLDLKGDTVTISVKFRNGERENTTETVSLEVWKDMDFVRKEENDSEDDLLFKAAQARFNHFTIRKKAKIFRKTGFKGKEFFYGYTTYSNLLCMEDLRMNHLDVFNSSLYYQAGDYCYLMLKNGFIEFTPKSFNKKISGKEGDYMIGIASFHNQGQRFYKWCYAGSGINRPLYNLYLLFRYGKEHYSFRGMSEEEILQKLHCPPVEYDDDISESSNEEVIHEYDPSQDHEHVYKAYAMILIFHKPLPDEWNLPDLEKNIKSDLNWVIQLDEHIAGSSGSS